MRAAVLHEPRTIRISHSSPRDPAEGEVAVRLAGSGVCGSNLPVWEGRPWFQYPLAPGAPGHEGWGTIAACGPGVVGLPPGTPVAVLSQHAFADYDVAPADAVVPIPPRLAGTPFPGEAIACAVNVMRRAGVEEGHRVAVVGIGFLGAILVRLAAAAGASVTAIGRRPFSLRVAEQMGARATVALEDMWASVNAARNANGGRDFDVVIEAAGAQVPLDVSAELMRIRGRLVIAGYHQDGSRQVNMQMWNWRGLDVVSAHERDTAVYLQGLRDAVRLVADGTIDLAPLLTHLVPLDEAARAFQVAEARPEGFLKAVVVTSA